MNLETRLAKLEGAARAGMTQIVVHGGLPGIGPDDHAHAGARCWRRGDAETVAAFRDRVLGDARVMEARCVIWGGLPE